MVKVGDKVKIKAVRHGGDLAQVNDVVTVKGRVQDFGFFATTEDGEEVYVCYDFDNSCADYLAGSIVTNETEAERRGAKFGVTGVYNPTGQRAVVVSTDKVTTPDPWPEKERWVVALCGSGVTHSVYSENIRLDHEPEYVAWSEAPEHLRYDASRVYFDGKPVKWIA